MYNGATSLLFQSYIIFLGMIDVTCFMLHEYFIIKLLFVVGRRKSRHRRHQHPSGSCFHHLIDSCPLPQCNASCPKYRNRYTGDEMDFFRMFIRYGIDKEDIASLLGKDVSVIQRMDDGTLSRLIMDFVGRGA